MRRRSTEHGHHGVPDELLHRPPVALDLGPKPRVIRPDPSPHVLRILPLRGGGEADQIAEQHRHDLPLLDDRAMGRSAIGAEQKPQKANPSGFSFPQFEQIAISRV